MDFEIDNILGWRESRGIWTGQGWPGRPPLRLSKKALKGRFAGCWIFIYGRGAMKSGCQNTGSQQKNCEGIGSTGKIPGWVG